MSHLLVADLAELARLLRAYERARADLRAVRRSLVVDAGHTDALADAIAGACTAGLRESRTVVDDLLHRTEQRLAELRRRADDLANAGTTGAAGEATPQGGPPPTGPQPAWPSRPIGSVMGGGVLRPHTP